MDRLLAPGEVECRRTGSRTVHLQPTPLSGLIVVCFGRFWVHGLPFPNARHLGHPFQWKNTLPCTYAPPPKSESSVSKSFRRSGIAVAFKAAFEIFTRVGPNNSFERLTERSVGLVTDRPSNVYELFVTLFK
jgi:hypothetical protein